MVTNKILLIDDDKDTLEMIGGLLRKNGYDVFLCENAENALKKLEIEQFPLIITDLNMPGMDGIRLCKIIRETNKKSIIYALSGHMEQHDIDRFETEGFDGHLIKPAQIETIKKAVKGAFEKINRSLTIT